MRRSIGLIALLLAGPLLADEVARSTHTTAGGWTYSRPGLFTWIRNQPSDQKIFFRRAFRQDNRAVLLGIAAATGLLIAADQSMFDETWRWGTKMRLNHSGTQRTIAQTTLPGLDYKIRLNGPYDWGTGLYFLGDGVTHFTITGSFLGWGLAQGDARALQTGSQLLEAIFANGLIVQILKHTTGRENPNTVTAPGGKWRFFPNQKDYAKNVAKYDAFPSGHLSTAMVTVTVISMNYPEKRWIKPLGYTLMSGLAFQMVNNGVHWYSDYPLAIGMGYLFAKIAVERGRTPMVAEDESAPRWTVQPGPVGGGWGLAFTRRFGGAPGSEKRTHRHG